MRTMLVWLVQLILYITTRSTTHSGPFVHFICKNVFKLNYILVVVNAKMTYIPADILFLFVWILMS